MIRKVFFSFHYGGDVGRIGQVRNAWVTKKGNGSANTYFNDKAKWEQIKRSGRQAIRNWINNQLKGTSVTAVLIGAGTSKREWVKYEIEKSVINGNGIIGIYLNNVKDFRTGKIDKKGANPFRELCLAEGISDGKKYVMDVNKYNTSIYKNGKYLSDYIDTYDWVANNGYMNIEKWIEKSIRSKKW